MNFIKSQSISKGAVVNGLSRALDGALSYLLLLIISKQFGAGIETDAYMMALGIPILFLILGENVISISFLPVFIDYREKSGMDKAREFTNSFFTAIVLFLGLVCLIVYLSAPQIARLLAPGFGEPALWLTSRIIRIMSPIILLAGIGGTLTSLFHSQHNFSIPALTSLLLVFGSIISLFILGGTIGIISIPLGLISGLVLQVIVEYVILYKHGRQPKFHWNFRHSGIKQIGKLAAPRFVGMAANRFNVMTDRFFASVLAGGGVSTLSYADKLIQFPSMFFMAAVGRTISPTLALHVSRGELGEVKNLISRWMRTLSFVLIPLMMMLFILHQPLIRLAFQRGAFNAQDAQLTSTAFFYYNMGLIPYSINIVLNVVFFCLQDTFTPMKIALGAVVLNIGLDMIFIKHMGIGGIALATALVAMLRSGVLFKCLRDKIGGIGGREIFRAGRQQVVAAGLMGILLWFITAWLREHLPYPNGIYQAFLIGSSMIAGAGIYLFLCNLLKVEEYQIISRFWAGRKVSQ